MEDLDTIAGRLKSAIEHAPREGKRRGLRLFQSRMEERAELLKKNGHDSFEGVSLSSIQTYVNGTVEPSPSFLREAADVLGVREAWLVVGQGPRTEEDSVELGSAGHALAETTKRRTSRIENAFSEGAGVRLPLRSWVPSDETPEPTLVVLLRLWKARLAQIWPREERTRLEVDIARQIGEAVMEPLHALGIEVDALSDDFIEEHVLSMAPVVRRAIDRLAHTEED